MLYNKYSIKMKGKYTRYDMIGAINHWCSKNGLDYFTYIEKNKITIRRNRRILRYKYRRNVT